MKIKKQRKLNLEEKESSELCPRCDQKMKRRKHKEVLEFLRKQPYYYKEWDYCRPCKYIQHYEEFKVMNK